MIFSFFLSLYILPSKRQLHHKQFFRIQYVLHKMQPNDMHKRDKRQYRILSDQRCARTAPNRRYFTLIAIVTHSSFMCLIICLSICLIFIKDLSGVKINHWIQLLRYRQGRCYLILYVIYRCSGIFLLFFFSCLQICSCLTESLS